MKRYTKDQRAVHKAVLSSMPELKRQAFAMAILEHQRPFAQRLWNEALRRYVDSWTGVA